MYLQVFAEKGLNDGRELGWCIEVQHVPGSLNFHPLTCRLTRGEIAGAARHKQHACCYGLPAGFGFGAPV